MGNYQQTIRLSESKNSGSLNKNNIMPRDSKKYHAEEESSG